MGEFLRFTNLKHLAEQNGWRDDGPGGCHPHIFVKPGHRPVPCQARIDRKKVAQSLLRQLGIPKTDWPDNCK